MVRARTRCVDACCSRRILATTRTYASSWRAGSRFARWRRLARLTNPAPRCWSRSRRPRAASSRAEEPLPSPLARPGTTCAASPEDWPIRLLSGHAHRLDDHGGVPRVIELVGLQYPGGSEHVDRFRHRVGVDGAVGIAGCRRTDAELERLRRGRETACLIRTEAVLTGQDHAEAPASRGVPQRGSRHAEGDEARDRVASDVDGAQNRAMGIDVALPESLDFDQAVPRSVGRDLIVALRE